MKRDGPSPEEISRARQWEADDPDDFWPDEPPSEFTKMFGQKRIDKLGHPLAQTIHNLEKGLWRRAVAYAESALKIRTPPDEIMHSLLRGAFAEFSGPWQRRPPRSKANLRDIWVGKYAELLRSGIDETEARQRLNRALSDARSMNPEIDPHFAGLPPHTGENGKPPAPSTVNRWTASYRARKN